MRQEDQSLNFVLVAVVGVTRPPVTIAQVWRWLHDGYAIMGDSITIHRFHPEDFLISFTFHDDMLQVLHNPPPLPHLLSWCSRGGTGSSQTQLTR
jgi:hypothetical protein